jgi:hypothetical protein
MACRANKPSCSERAATLQTSIVAMLRNISFLKEAKLARPGHLEGARRVRFFQYATVRGGLIRV